MAGESRPGPYTMRFRSWEKAASVIVLVVNPTTGDNGHGERPGADIALHLARHGCKVEAQHIMSGDVSVGDMILSRLADQGVDLLVMGAYGHARVRELIFGGVTRPHYAPYDGSSAAVSLA